MARAAGLAHDDTPQATLDKLDVLLARTATSKEDAALFAEMLSLASDGRYPALTLTPQQRRQRTLEALIAQTEALSRQNPLLMVFEDAQWADPTSLELLGRAIDRIASRRALLVVTFRPEFKPPWIGRPYVTTLGINRLAQPDVDAMIDRLVGTRSLPANIRRDIIERSDGIPLFVEEMTKAVLETESERRSAADRRCHSVAHAGRPGKLACVADGPTRPARSRQGGGADRGGDRARVLAFARSRSGRQTGAGIGIGAHASHCRRSAVQPRRGAARELCVQARAGAGRSLRHVAARTETRAPRPHSRNAGEPVCRDSRASTRTARASLLRGRADREGGKPVGQSGTAIAGALGAGRSRGAAQPCPRPDRHLARHAGAASHADQAPGRADNATACMSKATAPPKPRPPWSKHVC